MNQVGFLEKEQGYYLLSGQLVFDTVGDLANLVLSSPSSATHAIVVDCSQVSHMDSAGIALLVEWKRQAARFGHDLLLKDLPRQAEAIVKATRLDAILKI